MKQKNIKCGCLKTLKDSDSMELLTDIHEIFQENSLMRITTADLLAALTEDELKPWVTYNRGKPLSATQLAKLLEPYNISSKNLKIGYEQVRKGFVRSQFDDAFAGYITPSRTVSLGNTNTFLKNQILLKIQKNNNFKRLLKSRLEKVKEDLRLLGNLSCPSKYVYTEDDHMVFISEIMGALGRCNNRFTKVLEKRNGA